MKAKIIIQVDEIEDSEQCQFKTAIEGSNKLIIEGLLEALTQVESGDNEAETAILRLYTDFRLDRIRKEHDNAN